MRQWTERNKLIKYALSAVAVAIAVMSLLYSRWLVSGLERDVTEKMSVWGEAMRTLNNANENTDLNLVLSVLNANSTIPVVVVDSDDHVVHMRNIRFRYTTPEDSVKKLQQRVKRMRANGYAVEVAYRDGAAEHMEVLYEDSLVLKQLAIYPYIQLSIVAVFIIIIVLALLSWKREEQNLVWVGLTKETAHQLGTPISSLMGWVEMLKESYPKESMLPEMEKDVARLNLIAERFSKVGSKPEAQEVDLREVVWRVVDYVSMRTSNKVQMRCNLPATPVRVRMNAPLFEWVIENLCKNAIDAMEGRGRITVTVHEITGMIIMEISDTGKGIQKNHFKSVFMPGFTTKKRGWGLGLSLAKRIVEEYHHGRIYVKSSEMGRGTTFRIELKSGNKSASLAAKTE